MSLGAENIKTLTLTINSDPGGDGEAFYLMRAPRDLTILRARMVSEQTQNAGTAVTLELQNWGTAGTAVKTSGTVVVALGGTAVGARLTARTPASGSVNPSYDNISEGEYLVVNYGELGTGWISGDRFFYQVDYVFGVGA